MSKKALTWSVVVSAILWSMSAAFVVAPLTAKAATSLVAGDLIRGTVKSPYGGYPVFFYGVDGKKSLFSTEATYKTWYSDFSKVKVLPESELQAISGSDKNVTYRPGVNVVKFESESNLYVVEKGAMIRKVTDAVAKTLFGDAYVASQVPSAFRANYKAGADVVVATDYNKVAAMAASPDISTDMGGPSVVAPVGAVTVSLASDNPAGAVLPAGAAGVTLMKVNVASASGSTVTGMNFKRVGVGATADFANLYLYDGAKRLTTGRTIQSTTQEVQFTSLNLMVAAGGTKTLSLVADVAPGIASAPPTSGDTHGFSLTSVVSAAAVSGTPVTGSTFSIGSQDISTLLVQKVSTPSNPIVGTKNATISEFKLAAGNNDVSVSRVALIQAGTIPNGDLANLELWQGGAKIASVASMDGDKMRFVFDAPLVIPQGTTRIFTVKSDVMGYGGRTIITYVEYAADVYALDKTYSFGSYVDTGDNNGSGTFNSSNTISVTAQGGKATVAFNGPSASDISVGTQDALLYKFSITSGGQALDIRNIRANMLGSANLTDGTTPLFTDIALKNMDTGARIDTKEISGVASTTKDFVFNNSFTIPAGTTVNFGITADVKNVSTFANQTVKMTLSAFSLGDIKEINTNQSVLLADIVPSGASAVAGYNMTVKASSLAVQLASTPSTSSTVKGTKGVEAFGFSFATGSQSDVKINSIKLTGQANIDEVVNDTLDGYAADDLVKTLLSVTLWDGSTQVGTAKSPDSTLGTLTFDNLNWTVAAGQTKKLSVKVDAATTIAGLTSISTVFPRVWLGIAAVGDISAQDKDSNTVNATFGTSSPINSTPTVYLAVKNSGSISASLDGDTAKANIVVAGSTDVPMTKIKFTATDESFLVKKLNVQNVKTSTDGDNDAALAQVKLSYPKQDGTTEVKTGVLAGGLISFSDLNFTVPVNQEVVLSLSADASVIDKVGLTNLKPQLRLVYNSGFEAVGVGSGDTKTTVGGADITGAQMTLRKTRPTVTLAASSPAGAGIPGLGETLRFTVGADPKNGLDLKTVTFKVTSTANLAGSNAWNTPRGGTTGSPGSNGTGLWTTDFTLFDSADMSTAVGGTWTLYDSVGNPLANSSVAVVAYAEFHFTTPQNISANASKTFVLKTDTTGASSSADDTVRFDVADEVTNSPNFIWNETGIGANTANVTDGAATFAGIDGTYVKNLAVTGGTIVY